MTYALWVVALCQGVRTMLDVRAARKKGLKLLPVRFTRKRKRPPRAVRITEVP